MNSIICQSQLTGNGSPRVGSMQVTGATRRRVQIDSFSKFWVFYRSDDPTNSVKALKQGG